MKLAAGRGLKCSYIKSQSCTLTLSRCVPPTATLIRLTCDCYLLPASRYVGSTLQESDSKNNRVKVQGDKAGLFSCYEHSTTRRGLFGRDTGHSVEMIPLR